MQRAEKNALEERLEAGQNTLKSRENEFARVREELMVTKERLEEMEDGFKRLKASEHSLRDRLVFYVTIFSSSSCHFHGNNSTRASCILFSLTLLIPSLLV